MQKQAIAIAPSGIDHAKIAVVSATLVGSWAAVYALGRLLLALVG